jgi:hypothetical protein
VARAVHLVGSSSWAGISSSRRQLDATPATFLPPVTTGGEPLLPPRDFGSGAATLPCSRRPWRAGWCGGEWADPRPHPPPRGHGRILEEAEGSPELEDIHSPHVVPCRARLRAAPTGFLAAAWPSILLPLPLLCARGSWRPWQVVGPRWLQESLHRAKSEGGGGRRDFRVVNPIPRCRLDSGKMPTRNGWRDGSRPPVWMV